MSLFLFGFPPRVIQILQIGGWVDFLVPPQNLKETAHGDLSAHQTTKLSMRRLLLVQCEALTEVYHYPKSFKLTVKHLTLTPFTLAQAPPRMQTLTNFRVDNVGKRNQWTDCLKMERRP
jgi:hypothetical protein